MIFPAFKINWKILSVPMTWTLLLLNCLFFIVLQFQQNGVGEKISNLYKDEIFVRTQLKIYSQYLQNNEVNMSVDRKWVWGLAKKGYSLAEMRLVSNSLRDKKFLSTVFYLEPSGDLVAWKYWSKKLEKLLKMRSLESGYRWGLSASALSSWKNWFTYQFVHAGVIHLIGNMLFLFVFSSFIEMSMGSLFVFILYIGSGLVGAWSFSVLEGISLMPLVGASASVSGLMSFVVFLFWNKKMRYVYFMPFIKDQIGYLYLPTWIIAILWMLSDVSGYLSTVGDIGGVAYSAHLGGLWAGLLFWLGLKFFKNVSVKNNQISHKLNKSA